jgi:hypothetical protein
MAQRKTEGHTHRMSANLPVIGRWNHRKGRDRHEVVGAETVNAPEQQRV